MPVMAWKNQPCDLRRRRRSRRRAAAFQLVSPNVAELVDLLVDPVEDRRPPSGTACRRATTRSCVCQRRPSVSHGMAASLPTSSRSTSPVARLLGGVRVEARPLDVRAGVEHVGARTAAVCDGVRRPPLRDDVLRRPLGDDACRRPAPASGPRSMTQSAVLITSRLCSTTMTVLPRSTRRLSTSSSLRMSSKCRPVVGSSRR